MIFTHFTPQLCCTLAKNSIHFLDIQQKKITLLVLTIFSFIASLAYFCYSHQKKKKVFSIETPPLSPVPNQVISHLVLHFDINRTIIAEDSTVGWKLQDILSMLLAENCMAKWNGTHMSFLDYVRSLIPGLPQGAIKKQRQAILKDFIHLLIHSTLQDESMIDFSKLKEHPKEDLEHVKKKINEVRKQVLIDFEKLRHSEEFEKLKNKILHDYTQMEGKLLSQSCDIFPSFFRLIEWLKTKKNVHFHIVFRTFGNDAQKVILEIEKRFPEQRFTHLGKYLEGKWMITSVDGSQKHVLEKAHDVYRYFKSGPYQHLALQDDWKEWNAHQENHEHGKRFLVKMNAKYTHAMFIDDNLQDGTTEKNIVTAIDIKSEKLLSIRSLIAKKIAVRTDPIAAICDDNYFVNVVQDSLALNGKIIS